ncbi:MAG: hypothetical protein WBO32_05075 [Cyclobacteriaceae bacterium]
MPDLTKVKVGVCTVVFGGIDLGHTQGGVEVTYAPEYHEVEVDKYGTSLAEQYLIGERFTAKVPLAEFTIANLKNSMPAGTFAGAANSRILLGSSAGKKMSTFALPLVLHPISEGTRAFDVVMYKAIAMSEITLNHKNDEEKIIEVEFAALIDESKTDGNYLGLIGDSTL